MTVRASERIEEFTANLRAPIVIADGIGQQVINEAPGAELRAPLFAELAPRPPPSRPPDVTLSRAC